MFDVYSRVRMVPNGDVNIAVTDHGPESGAPVLFIHGFPDSARLWRHQVPVLAEAGYRVLAPDLRGFGRSDAPEGVAQYDMPNLISDLLAVLDDAGVGAAHVVGHDWGAATGWALADRMPERVKTLTALSVGHPAGFLAAGLRQREKSWYMLLFQFEGVAERWLSDDDWHWLRRWKGTGEIDLWISDLSRPGRLTATLNVYRANVPPESLLQRGRQHRPVAVPVMGVWSSEDVALTETQMTTSSDYVTADWRYERLEGVGHWIPVDAPDRLNALLLDWLPGPR